jgi:hypothetical protein
MRRATLLLALAPVVAGPAAGALAMTSTDTTNPAPPAESSATALKVDGLAEAGHTHAKAGSTGGTADADALGLGGKTLVDGKTGGSQTGEGSAGGALLDTDQTPLGRLAVTPWSASVAGNTAAAESAVAYANLIEPKVLEVWVLHSRSDAAWSSDESSSSSTSDGAEVNAGDGALDIKVLHSEANSSGKGSSSILVINDNDVISSDDADGACTIAIPDILELTCLDATGGTGTQAGADVGTVNVGGEDEPQGVVSGVETNGGTAGDDTGAGGDTTGDDKTRVLGEKVPETTSGAGNLPFTGSNIGLLTAYGAALSALGAAILRVARRRPEQV